MKRRTGLSTAHILQTLSQAILRPGSIIYYVDHASHHAKGATRFHLDTVKEMVSTLGLNMKVSYDQKAKAIKIQSLHLGVDDDLS